MAKKGGSESVAADGTRTKHRFWASSSWKERHFVLLENGWLCYWETRDAAFGDAGRDPKGQLLLDQESEFVRLPSDSSEALTFTVFGATTDRPGAARREITLRCASDEDLEHWLLCLNHAIQRAAQPAVGGRAGAVGRVTFDVPSEQQSADLAELAKRRARDRANGGSSASAGLLTHERSFPPSDEDDDGALTREFSTNHLAALRRVQAENQAEQAEFRRLDELAKLRWEEEADGAELEQTISQIQEVEQTQQWLEREQQRQEEERQRDAVWQQRQAEQAAGQQRRAFREKCESEGLTDAEADM